MENSYNDDKDLKDETSVDNIVSISDVLREENQLEADAVAVLGNSDDKNCTYPKGYISRQALYSCQTCNSANNGAYEAGICLACSYACHEGHQLYELYTKRNFRCDCGNSKFPMNRCCLFADKCEFNDGNKYNQNFKGLYCTCAKPYPDEEDEVDDVMIQCIICEDWYHGRHIAPELPSDEDYEEMVCKGCLANHRWLCSYVAKSEVHVTSETSNVDIVSNNSAISAPFNSDCNSGGVCNQTISNELKREVEDEVYQPNCSNSTGALNLSNLSSVCHLFPIKSHLVDPDKGEFFPHGWRSKLCRCSTCMEKYKVECVLYLIDKSDSLHEYEKMGVDSDAADDHSQIFNNMNRVVLGEMIQGYNEMKNSLKDYLRKFAENKKVVREEDIREFFEAMEKRKKRRINDMPPANCR